METLCWQSTRPRVVYTTAVLETAGEKHTQLSYSLTEISFIRRTYMNVRADEVWRICGKPIVYPLLWTVFFTPALIKSSLATIWTLIYNLLRTRIILMISDMIPL